MLNDKTIELIQEMGKLPMRTIENLAELQADLKEAGYISYLDPSTDWLIVEEEDVELWALALDHWDNPSGIATEIAGYNAWDYLPSAASITRWRVKAEAERWLENHTGPDEFGVQPVFKVIDADRVPGMVSWGDGPIW